MLLDLDLSPPIVAVVCSLQLDMWNRGNGTKVMKDLPATSFHSSEMEFSDFDLVVDLGLLNRFIAPNIIRMLTVAQVCLDQHLGASFIILPLESAYWDVAIAPRYRHFLAV